MDENPTRESKITNRPAAKRFGLSFSIRSLLVLILLSAIALAFFIPRTKEVAAARALAESGFELTYYPDQMIWLNKWTDDTFRYVKSIRLPEQGLEPVISADLYPLPYLKSVEIADVSLKGDLCDFLEKCPRLETLILKSGLLVELEDRNLMWLASLDEVQVQNLSIKNSALSGSGLEALSNIPFKELHFYFCELSAEGMRSLEIDLDTQAVHFVSPKLKATEIIEAFGNDARHLIVEGHRSFQLAGSRTTKTSNYGFSGVYMDNFLVEVNADCFKSLPLLEDATFSVLKPSFLKAIENCQPSIEVKFLDLSGTELKGIAKMVEGTPSLTGLVFELCWEQSNLRFTPEHQLKRLELGDMSYNADFFTEVGKLRGLEELSIVNTGYLGAEIAPLLNLKHLKRFSFSRDRLTYDARKLIEGQPWAKN